MESLFLSEWILLVILSGIFSLIAIAYYYKKDKIEPEPKSQIFIAFVLGIVSSGLAFALSLFALMILVQVFILNKLILGTVSAVIIAPVVEEFCKAIMVVILSRYKSFDGPLDGLVYGAVVGAGFAFSENILYGFTFASDLGIKYGLGLTVFRGALQILGHPLYTGLVGAGIGAFKVKLSKTRWVNFWRSVLLHAAWNFVAGFSPLLIIIILVYGYNLLRKEIKLGVSLDQLAYNSGYYERKRLQEQLKDEPAAEWQNL